MLRGRHLDPVLLALLAVAAVYAASYVVGLEQLPSPIHGGDANFQRGCIESIRATGDPLASCSVSGALPGYLPLYSWLVVAISLVSGRPVVEAMFAGSVLVALGATGLFYALFRLFYARAVATVLTGVFLVASGLSLSVKYTEFARFVGMPLFFLTFFAYLRAPSLRRALAWGTSLGLLGLTHAVAFAASLLTAAFALAILYGRALGEGIRERDLAHGLRSLRRRARSEIGPLSAAAAVAFLLALPYWYEPLLVHGLSPSLHYTEWNGNTPILETPAQMLAYTGRMLGDAFRLEYEPFPPLGWLLTAALGLSALLLLAAERAARSFAPLLVATAAALLALLHYVVTVPLLSFNLVPRYMNLFLFLPLQLLVLGYGVSRLFERFPRLSALHYATPLLVAIALVPVHGNETRGRVWAAASEPLPGPYAAARDWIRENSEPNDVFLSTNELSFKVAALTGRKVLVTRRAQNDAFVDMDVRNRDAAILLYGDDPEKTRELLLEHGVDYLYWDFYWVESEYELDRRGRIVGTFDPLLMFAELGYGEELARYGVRTRTLRSWVDPSIQGEDVPKFDLTLVTPDNYRSSRRPWSATLDRFLEPVFRVDSRGGEPVARIFAVRVGGEGPS